MMLIQKIAKIIKDAGHDIYLVGGCVRDEILKRIPNDYDFTTSATPVEIKEIFTKYGDKNISIKDTGIKHLTLTIVVKTPIKNEKFEITTFRSDHNCDGRHADVAIASSLKEDCSRRDFTINALALDPFTGEIIDYFGGIEDIKRKVIRAIGTVDDRLKEDWLRMMRAVRFGAQLGFKLNRELASSIEKNAKNLRNISSERIRDEFFKILGSPSKNLRAAIYFLSYYKLLENIIPPLQSMVGFSQRSPWHKKDVFEHSVDAMENISRFTENPLLRFAALIHDVGKLMTRRGTEGHYRFTNHAHYSAKLTEMICEELKMKRSDINFVKELVKSHMDVKHLKEACNGKFNKKLFSRFIRKHYNILNPLLMLGKSDIEIDDITEFISMVESFDFNPSLITKNKKISSIMNGNEIMEFFDYPHPGRWIKSVKNLLIEKEIEGVLSKPEEAKEFLSSFNIGDFLVR